MHELPYYGLRAYALLYSKYGSREVFGQSVLDWIVSDSMKKKIISKSFKDNLQGVFGFVPELTFLKYKELIDRLGK